MYTTSKDTLLYVCACVWCVYVHMCMCESIFVTQVALWVVNHMPDGEKKRKLQELLQNGRYKVKYMHYNWEVNSS